jgi:hypothetical protein
MNEISEQICSINKIIEEICNDVEKNDNFNLIPEFMNVMEAVLPNIFSQNKSEQAFNEEEIFEILNDIVDAFENKDTVLIIDTLKYGLSGNLNKLAKVLNE